MYQISTPKSTKTDALRTKCPGKPEAGNTSLSCLVTNNSRIHYRIGNAAMLQRMQVKNDCIQRIVIYNGKTYNNTTDQNISLNAYNKDALLKGFFKNYNALENAITDANRFNIDRKLCDADNAISLKIQMDFPSDQFFIVGDIPKNVALANLDKCYFYEINTTNNNTLNQHVSKRDKNIKEILKDTMISIWDKSLPSDFITFHSRRVFIIIHEKYDTCSENPDGIKSTSKTRERFQYQNNSREKKIQPGKTRTGKTGKHYIYRSMPPSCAMELEIFWSEQSPLPENPPDDFNIHKLGLDGHMGNVDQAFTKYNENGGTPVEFEIDDNNVENILTLTAYGGDYSQNEREVKNGEGIPATKDSLGLKTEFTGGSFSFGLPGKNALGSHAKAIVWKFLRHVKSVKVYHIRPQLANLLAVRQQEQHL